MVLQQIICNYSLHTYVGLACAIWLIRMVKTLIGTAISRKKTFYPIIKWKAAKWSFLLALCVAQPNKLRIAHPIVSTFVQIVSTWKDLATKQITECINGNLSSLVVKVNLICGHMFHLMIFILKVQTLKCFNMWTWKKNLIYCKILSVAYRKIQIW